jgi:hypothetical protein
LISHDHGGYFIEADTDLADDADSATCALYFPCALVRENMRLRPSVDARLARALREQVGGFARNWWGYRPPKLRTQVVDRRPVSNEHSMFFSGGVDSFFTLKRNLGDLRSVVFVHGFDIPLSDTDRHAQSAQQIRQVTSTLGLDVISVRTDLRRDRLFELVNWEVAHVSALAAMAHALKGRASRFHIASSDVPPPWGSHPDLDPLWSSSAVELINDDAHISRLDKVGALADWEPALEFVRVCWENRSSALNCGVCEKCVRTMTQFSVFDALSRLKSFPQGDHPARIRALKPVAGSLHKQWSEIRARSTDAAIVAAVEDLLARSRPADGQATETSTAALPRERRRLDPLRLLVRDLQARKAFRRTLRT